MPQKNNFTYSKKGLQLTEQFEGLRLTAYQDQVGVWTIGYGHTGKDVRPGLTITQQQAEDLLAKDVASAAASVNQLVTVVIGQNQFDALVDFTFNLGAGALGGSTLLRKLNAGDFAGAAAEFPKWCRAGGKVVLGLQRRRQAEQALFLQAMPQALAAAAPAARRSAAATAVAVKTSIAKPAPKKQTAKKAAPAKEAAKKAVKKAAKKSRGK